MDIKEKEEDFILDQSVMKWITYLWNDQDIQALYSKIVDVNTNNANNEIISEEVHLFCKLYLSLILKIPTYSNEILSILLYTKNIGLLSKLWEFTSTSTLVNEIISQTPITKLISSNFINK